MARIAVGMSGGVDSSLAAALLREQGHDVVGITLRLWDGPRGRNSCCRPCEVDDAKAAAAAAGVPHRIIDATGAFRREVVDGFVAEYAAGRTPNPCVRCNERIKFGLLWDEARALGATHLATGHYARIAEVEGRLVPRRAADPPKDQSYFLFPLSQAQLAAALFPLGGMAKPAVRAAAQARGLPTAHKRDSMDICFVAADGVAGFLRRERPDAFRPGPVRDQSGRAIGGHQGIAAFTIGQRRGLGVSGHDPRYVIDIDQAENAVVLGPRAALLVAELPLARCTWHLGPLPEQGLRVLARPRYRSPGLAATVLPTATGAVVRFDSPQVRPAAGQACVCYDPADDLCLGGGWVD